MKPEAFHSYENLVSKTPYTSKRVLNEPKRRGDFTIKCLFEFEDTKKEN